MQTETKQLQHLFDAIYHRYGYDFRHYAVESAMRRVQHQLQVHHLPHIPDLERAVLRDDAVFDGLLRDLSINVTEMFRDPEFYRTLRQTVLPTLSLRPHLRIWHAGCATGEEVYSMAILLHESELYTRSRLYATDYNKVVLEQAKQGIYPLDRMRVYIQNYQAAGGQEAFSDYYHAQYASAAMGHQLKQAMRYAYHDLTQEGPFTEVDMVVCRNVLIYFDRCLQTKVLQTFHDSLSSRGFLCLGTAETLQANPIFQHFEVVNAAQRIYRKVS